MTNVTPFQDKKDKRGNPGKTHHFLSGPFPDSGRVPELQSATTLLGRFVIKKHIANGRGTAVYLAEDLLQIVDVALKIVDAGPMSEESNSLHLRHELKVNRMLSEFEHIIKVFDVHSMPLGGTTLFFLSMEYADGGNLREWLIENQDHPELRLSIGLHYFMQACRGCCSLHDAGIFRPDLKPENMGFIKGVLKIYDTGSCISRSIMEEGNQPGADTFVLNRGTPQYMSPEQFSSDYGTVSPKSDIYSLGVILYELAHPRCHLPFEGSPEVLRELHLNATPPPIPNLPANLGYVISRCLDKNPDRRYESARELLADLGSGSVDGSANFSEKLDEILPRAEEFFYQGDFNTASRLLEEALSIEPGNEAAMELRSQIKERFDQAESCYRTIIDQMEQSDLGSLVRELRNAVSIYRDHPGGILPQTRLAAKVSRFRAALENGAEALKKRLWEQAFHLLNTAYQLDGGNVQIKATIDVLGHIIRLREEVNQALVQDDFSKARRLARLADVVIEEMRQSVPVLSQQDPGMDETSV
jgi:serine/threonine protein kinase